MQALFSNVFLSIKNYESYYYFFISVLVCIVVTNFAPFFFFLAPVSLTFLFLFLQKNRRAIRFSMLWLFSFLYMLGVFISILNLHPLTWAGVFSTQLSIFIVLTAWLVISAFTSLFFTTPFLLSCKIIFSELPIYKKIIFGASFFVVAEILRTVAIWLLSYGEQSLFGLHYTYVSFGYTLTLLPTIKYIFSLGGLYAADFLFFALNYVMYLLIVKTKRNFFVPIYIGFFSAIFVCNYLIEFLLHTYIQPKGHLHVAVVRTRGESMFKDGGGQPAKTAQAEKEFETLKPVDLVVLPESTGFLSSSNSANAKVTNSFLKDKTRYVIDSGRTYNNVSAFFYDITATNTIFSDKQLLMPQGEYMLSSINLVAHIFGGDTWANKFRRFRGGDKGFITHTFPVISNGSTFQLNTHICFELFSPSIYMKNGDESHLLINLSSLASFHDSLIVKNQTMMMARARALEQYKSIAVAANMSDSYVINEQGYVTAQTSGLSNIIYSDVNLFSSKTTYSYFRDYMIWLALILAIWYLLCTRLFLFKKG